MNSSNVNPEQPNSRYVPSLSVDISATANLNTNISSVTATPNATTPAPTPHVPTNIFVARLPASWTEETLIEKFKCFGDIISAKVVPRRHFGFVMFRRPEEAHAAINATHQTRPHPNSSTLLHVSIAMHDEGIDDLPNSRLFIRGLPQWATKEHLHNAFSRFGKVVQCDVLVNYQGQCKGSGFVQFTAVEEATAALEAAASIRIDNWDAALEIKYSESSEAHQQRQERNRNRHKLWSHSPKYPPPTSNLSPSLHPPSPPSFQPPLPISPPSYVIVPLYSAPQGPPTATIAHGPPMLQPSMTGPMTTSMHHAPMMTSSLAPPMTPPIAPSPMVSPPSVYLVPSPPQSGDLSFMAPNISVMVVGALLQSFGTVEKIYSPGQEHTIAARMTDSSKHAFIAQHLNGAILATGDILVVGLYS